MAQRLYEVLHPSQLQQLVSQLPPYLTPLNRHWVSDVKSLPPSCLNHHKASSLQLTPHTMLPSNCQSRCNPRSLPASCLLRYKPSWPSFRRLLANLSPTPQHHLEIYLQHWMVGMSAAPLQPLNLLTYNHIKLRIIKHGWLPLPRPSPLVLHSRCKL